MGMTSQLTISPGKYVGCHSEADAHRSQWGAGLAVDGPQAHHQGEEGGHDRLCQRDQSQVVGEYHDGSSNATIIHNGGEHSLKVEHIIIIQCAMNLFSTQQSMPAKSEISLTRIKGF